MHRSVTVVGLLLLLFSSAPVSSQPAITAIRLKSSPTLTAVDIGNWKSVSKGVAFRKMALERSDPSHSIDLKLFRFDNQWTVPRVLRSAQFQLKGANAKTFVEKSGAIAAI